MKTNSNFHCGLPSSSKLHNPEIRRLNRMEKRAQILLLKRRADKAEAARLAFRDQREKQEQLTALPTLKDRAVRKIKAFFRKIGCG